MEEHVKICPECDAEFFPHVEVCNVCGVELVYPEEMEKLEKAKKQAVESQQGPPVLIEQGSLPRLKELADMLEASGIECRLLKMDHADRTCNKQEGFGLFVPQSVSEHAHNLIEEYWLELHPELRDAKQRINEGRCPACGCEVSGTLHECPDCGLFLGGAPEEEPH